MPTSIITTVALSLLVGVVASLIWSHKGGGRARGFWLGTVLGFAGLLFVAAATPRRSTRLAIGVLVAFAVVEALSLAAVLHAWFSSGSYEAWVMVVITSGFLLAYAALAIVALRPLVVDAWGLSPKH